MSTGEKVGIGIGVTIAGIVLIAIVIWTFRSKLNDGWESGTQVVKDKVNSWHLDPLSHPGMAKTIYSETPPAPPQVPLTELR